MVERTFWILLCWLSAFEIWWRFAVFQVFVVVNVANAWYRVVLDRHDQHEESTFYTRRTQTGSEEVQSTAGWRPTSRGIMLLSIFHYFHTLIEWLPERTEHLDIFLFSAHHSMVFCFRCSVYWWKESVRF